MLGFLSGDSEWVCSYRVGFIPALKHEAFALTFRNLEARTTTGLDGDVTLGFDPADAHVVSVE